MKIVNNRYLADLPIRRDPIYLSPLEYTAWGIGSSIITLAQEKGRKLSSLEVYCLVTLVCHYVLEGYGLDLSHEETQALRKDHDDNDNLNSIVKNIIGDIWDKYSDESEDTILNDSCVSECYWNTDEVIGGVISALCSYVWNGYWDKMEEEPPPPEYKLKA